MQKTPFYGEFKQSQPSFIRWVGCVSVSLALVACQSIPLTGPGQGASNGGQASGQPNLSADPNSVHLQFDPSLLNPQLKTSPLPFEPQSERGVGDLRALKNLSAQADDFSIKSLLPLGKPVLPILECVQHNPDGSYTAHFGYNNTGTKATSIPAGILNGFLELTPPVLPLKDFLDFSARKGQPTSFAPGRTSAYPNAAFNVNFRKGALIWHLNGYLATATTSATQKCPAVPPVPTPTSIATPTPAPLPTPVPTPLPTPVPTPTPIAFYPVAPGQLSELYPNVPGNNPNAAQAETFAANFTLNDHPLTPVQNGVIHVQIVEPEQQNLQLILNKYNAQIISGPAEGFYWITVDMTKVSLSQLEANLIAINQRVAGTEYVIANASFANLESAKTFALFADLVANNLVKSVGFNYLQPAASVNTHEGSPASNPALPLDSNKAWWLNEQSTHITEAWDYSMGYNLAEDRPIRVVVMDEGKGRDLNPEALAIENPWVGNYL